MRKLIIVPARGGSKGIPLKNIFPLNGKPLLAYTLEVALQANMCDTDIVVSSDSDEILNVAKGYNDVIIIKRPADISSDTSSTESALLHSLDYMSEVYKKNYDAVITLQATSPLRKAETLREFVNTYEKNFPKYDALLSLNINTSDFWVLNNNESFERLNKLAPRRRQDREPLYVENSAYYITSVESLKKTKSVLGSKINGFVISEYEAVDINNMIDIYIAESIIRSLK